MCVVKNSKIRTKMDVGSTITTLDILEIQGKD